MFQTGNRGLTLQFIQLFSLCKKHHDHCRRFREEYVGFPKQFYLFFYVCTSSIEEIQILAALAFLPGTILNNKMNWTRLIWKKGMNSSCSSKSSTAKQTALKELNKWIPNRSDERFTFLRLRGDIQIFSSKNSTPQRLMLYPQTKGVKQKYAQFFSH